MEKESTEHALKWKMSSSRLTRMVYLCIYLYYLLCVYFYGGRLRLFVIHPLFYHYCKSTHTAHTDNENYLSRALERLGTTALSKDQEAEIGAAFIKFSVVTKELSALLRTLVNG